MSGLRVISNICKEYPDMYKFVIYKQPKVFVTSNSPKRLRELTEENYTPSVSSLRRTKTLIKDIVYCNDFELFCTFTFNPKKVNSYNFTECWFVLQRWLIHQRDNSREKGIEFKYLVIPEKHKSGRWHFHGLISGFTSTLKPSGMYTEVGNPIYNITAFRSGFTTAVHIDSKEGVSNYVAKYITKDFIKTFNQRRFFCSRNLDRPVKTLNSEVFSFTLPLFKRKVAENSETEEFIIDKIQTLCKNDGSTIKMLNVGQCIK